MNPPTIETINPLLLNQEPLAALINAALHSDSEMTLAITAQDTKKKLTKTNL